MSRVARVEGRGLPLPGPNIDTDRIIPARFLRTVSFDGLEAHAFADDRAAAAAAGGVHPFDEERFAGAAILIVDENFGCGSSREHAPQALYRRGIRAIVGESFSEIFFGNALMLGVPCVAADRAGIEALRQAVADDPQARIVVDLERGTVTTGALTCACDLPANAREALLTGAWDATGLLIEDYGEVERVAAALPYLRQADISRASSTKADAADDSALRR